MAGAGTIVEREVLRGQRRWQTFAFRGGFATALFGLFVLQYRDLTAWQDWSRPSDMAYVGERLFEMTMFGQWWLLGLLTPILVAQGIVEEKNQGTLDLLAISQITPAQLLRGKVYSSLSHVGLLVLAGLPVVALSLSFGGVAPASILVAYGCTFAGVLTLASLSAFFAMFARGPLGPLLLTWGTAFFGWIVMALPAIIAADDEDAFGWMSLAYAFFEGIDEPRLWIAWPVLLWIGLSFAIMHLAGQVFVSLLASRGGEDPDSALLSVEVWGIERLRRRQALRLTVLVFTGPIPLLSGYYGGRFALLLIPSFVWVQLALFTSLVAVLLAARSLLLKTAS
ncbi:MAG: hypothetical protein KDA24_18605, partial [Deltaproteobacteria bacterium]|nr:hypothetical protein [Deltaproteobacteria bacterium]